MESDQQGHSIEKAQEHLNKAYDFEALDDLETALYECEAAIRWAPDWAEAHNVRGVILDGLGRTEQAISEYRAAIQLDPQFTRAAENLRELLGEGGLAAPPLGQSAPQGQLSGPTGAERVGQDEAISAMREQMIHREQSNGRLYGWRAVGAENLERLGQRLDGWADIVEGAGTKTNDMTIAFREQVSKRQMPHVICQSSELVARAGQRRNYHLIRTETGVTLAVYIGRFGSGLYFGWDMFFKPLLNTNVIAGIIIAAVLTGLCPSLVAGAITSLTRGSRGINLLSWLFGTVVLAVAYTLLVAIISRVFRGNLLALFFKELTFFDAHDIAATGMAVHRSLLNAADRIGIDTHVLRVKEQFQTGPNQRLI